MDVFSGWSQPWFWSVYGSIRAWPSLAPSRMLFFPWSCSTTCSAALQYRHCITVLDVMTAVRRHFGEPPPVCSRACACCTSGGSGVRRTDVTAAGRDVCAALAALPAADKRATLAQLVKAWRSTVRMRLLSHVSAFMHVVTAAPCPGVLLHMSGAKD
jgi:hypothetical protein